MTERTDEGTDPRVYVDRRDEGAYVTVDDRNNIVSIHPSLHESAVFATELDLPVMFIRWNETTLHDPSWDEFFAPDPNAGYASEES